MKIQTILDHLNAWAPQEYAEDFDNTGLLVGDVHQNCTGALITLDTLPKTIDEAITKNCNLIISFHPIIFKGLKSITGKDYVEQTLLKAIKNDIAIFALHTALDNHIEGVSHGMANALELVGQRILVPQKNTLKKLTTYVPKPHVTTVLQALYTAGAGHVGAYDHCSFSNPGTGSFRGDDNSTPAIGSPNEDTQVEEVQLHLVVKRHLEKKVLQALFKAHPYEEVAYEITALDNSNQTIGMGIVGELPKPLVPKVFLDLIKERFGLSILRHTTLRTAPISKVAVLGGSGAFALGTAKAQGAHAYITADLKYHDFFQGNDNFLLADIGHYESEQFTKTLILNFLNKKIPNFAFALAQSTNPVNYY